MRLALLAALLVLPLGAQQASVDVIGMAKVAKGLAVHPKVTFHAIQQHPLAMMGASLTLGFANGLDYATTELGPGQHPAKYCEQIVTTGQPCQLDHGKFKDLKLGTAIFAGAQWLPVIFAPRWKHQQTYQATIVLIDGGLSVPMMKAVGGNVSALQKGGNLP